MPDERGYAEIPYVKAKLGDEGIIVSTTDWLQFGNLVVISITLLALFFQIRIQNRLAKAQILRDRFEMYWKTYEPVSEGQIAEFHMNPEDYVEKNKYEAQYKDNEYAVRKYIGMAQLYEYLAFLYTLRQMRVPDPLGEHWLDTWVRSLLSNVEFRDVHEHYRQYYPAFARTVDRLWA